MDLKRNMPTEITTMEELAEYIELHPRYKSTSHITGEIDGDKVRVMETTPNGMYLYSVDSDGTIHGATCISKA